MPDRDTEEGGELIRFYSEKFTTTKGYVDIVFRNSSNGYYGGEILLGETPKCDLRQHPDCLACPERGAACHRSRNMKEITDDWSA